MTSNSEKPVALAVIVLRLSEGISQSVTYSVSICVVKSCCSILKEKK